MKHSRQINRVLGPLRFLKCSVARFQRLRFPPKGLATPSAFLSYVQTHGTNPMHLFAAQNIAKLPAFLADASAWGEARAVAAAENVTDWALLCRAADTPCPNGHQCAYHKAKLIYVTACAMSCVP